MQLALTLQNFAIRSLLHRVATLLSCSILLAISAQIMVPMLPVPVTLQSLVVLFIGALYGKRLGGEIVLTYIAAGICGLPVFAGATGGLDKLIGPTGGYICGFLLAAVVTGYLYEKIGQKFIGRALAISAGMLAIYVPGITWLATFIGMEQAIVVGLVPFIIGDLLKAGLALVLSESIALHKRA